jgi:nucleoside-diphosphate-sugar epimerase
VKILVFGANGHIAKNLLLSEKANTFEIISAPTLRSGLDLLDLTSLTAYVNEVDFDLVINSTGYLPQKNTKTYGFDINKYGSSQIVKALLLTSKIKPLVHLSSATEVIVDSRAESEYSASKIMGFENLQIANEDNLIPIIQIVMHNILGKDYGAQNLINQLISNLGAGRSTFLDYPNRIRDFVWIDDCIDSIFLILQTVEKHIKLGTLTPNHRFEIGTGTPISISELAMLVCDELTGDRDLILCNKSIAYDPFSLIVANLGSPETISCKTSLEVMLKRMLS